MVAASTAPGINGLVINVGAGAECTIRDLVRLVLDVTGSQANVVYNQQIEGGVSRMCANIALAEKRLNFKPAIGLKEGLRLTLERDPRFKG
jgi:nucleoside-diphosphate-sugar epimerase